ncbi:quattro isoform X2 [Denticeps clupeoides]|uniref:Uncharacterized protein n=1 Tax=Denticeps clupeoides TaxID=299321 RepID=A0AAY4ET98_9TELE|nr:uncharacterized protein KIAA1755-like isoform X2 [Denticeps clupeoides]
MNPSSLDWSIQNTLSSLFPPFEATAPTVLSQLFRTIEERFHGDALQCLLDFLIPAKHILESVQQAACAGYSDVLFRCEGWPLCLHDRVVIQLAPINPLLLRPGDFYLQVEAFGDQAARIVLKSLLVPQEGLDSVEVEETPVPEMSYPCIFTETWLQGINEGRHGPPLRQCVLSSDQGVVKVPWVQIAKPEFLDSPKNKLNNISSSSPFTTMRDPHLMESQLPADPSSLAMETRILPAKDGISVSLLLVDSSSRLVKVDQGAPASNPPGKPVGWVSPNTWDSKFNRELEGEYVDLVEFAKEKESLALNKSAAPPVRLQNLRPVRPAPPAPKRDNGHHGHGPQLSGESGSPYYKVTAPKDPESKGRHRDSYMAAIKNPVNFERGSALAPLQEAELGSEDSEPSLEGPRTALDPSSGGIFAPQSSHLAGQPWLKSQRGNHTEAGCRPQASLGLTLGQDDCQKGAKSPINTNQQTNGQLSKSQVPETGLVCQEFPESERQQQAGKSHLPPPTIQNQRQTKHHKTPLQSPNPHQVECKNPSQTKRLHPNDLSDDPQDLPEPCGSTIEAQKAWGKSRAKPRSQFSVSETAREYLQAHRPPGRSCSDICPEAIPIAQALQCRKVTAFGLVSPKVARKQSSIKDILHNPVSASARKPQMPPADKLCAAQRKQLVLGHRAPGCLLTLESITSLLPLGIACLPGSRDRAGRAVVEIYGDRKGWASPAVNPLQLHRMLLYFHSVPRKEVRDLGLTLVIDSRKAPPSLVLYRALLMTQERVPNMLHSIVMLLDKDLSPRPERHPGLQMEVITSLKALHKIVDGQQLTPDLGGSLQYSHNDWVQFHQKLTVFLSNLQGASSLLQRAIKRLESTGKTDTVQDVKACIEEQKSSMKEVLQDACLVTLQREGGAMLARMRKEEFRFSYSEDYRDAMDTVSCLYNQVEERVHALVMKSNQSLQHLDHLLQLKTMEEKLTTILQWCSSGTHSWMEHSTSVKDTLETVESKLKNLDSYLTLAKEKQEEGERLIQEADKILKAFDVAADEFQTVVNTFQTSMTELLVRADQQRHELEMTLHLYRFCEQAMSLVMECRQHLEHAEMDCNPLKANESKLEVYAERFQEFSGARFQEVKNDALAMKGLEWMRVWGTAWAQCQDVRRRLEERLQAQGSACPRQMCAGELKAAEDSPIRQHSPDGASPSPGTEGQDPGGGPAPQVESRDRRARESEEATIACFTIHLKPEEKGKRGRVMHSVVQTINEKDPKILFSPKNAKNNTTSCHNTMFANELNDLSNIQSLSEELSETKIHPVVQTPHIKSSDTPLPNRRRGPREHHSDSDLQKMDLTGARRSDKHALERSHSEGSCVEPSHSNVDRTPPRGMLGSPVSQNTWHISVCSNQSHYGQSGAGKKNGGSEDLEIQASTAQPSNPASPVKVTPLTPTDSESSLYDLKLQRIMEELLQTEREYVRALAYVMEHYFPQLERPDVPQDLRGQRGSIFGNLEKLCDFHTHHFLQELELCLREPFRVGHCFLKHKESFGLYALYSKNKPRSDNLLKHHGHFFKQKQLALDDKMDLSSYLLKPVQRISKYNLLLQDMVRECGPGPARGRELAEIQAALEVIQFQLRHGNNLLAMDDIQECDVNLKEQGQLIRQDEFLVSFRKKKCFRHIFLFRDLILFSKTKKTEVGNDVYIYKQSFKTSDIGMTHNCGDSGLCFEIWFRRRKSQDTYVLQAGSVEVKEGWTRDLEKILWEQAIHNREVRMQERVFMGIGHKPFIDLQPSDAAINDRAIKCALTGREYKALPSSGTPQGGLAAPRPDSMRSTSSSASRLSSSSSSSGRGSMSPVEYMCGLNRQGVMGHGVFSAPGVLEEDDLDASHNILVDSSESSGESVSGFSSSGRSCHSGLGAEVDDPCCEPSLKGCVSKKAFQEAQDESSHTPKPLAQTRDQALKEQVKGMNVAGKSTEV